MRARPLLLVFFVTGLVSSASADIAVMSSGKILYIEGFERADEQITLFLEGGGEVTIPAEIVTNIVPNEIVEDTGQAPQEIRLLPHLGDLIEPAAAKYALDPNLVAAVIWAESSGDPKAVSTKGASGLMQLMPGTARDMGVSDVLDPSQNVDGGSRYLRKMLDRHDGDLSLALAAYNAGPEAVRKYGGIPPFLETQNYVGKVMRAYERARETDE